MSQSKRQRIARLCNDNKTVKEYIKNKMPLSKCLKLMFENNMFEPIKNMEEIIYNACEESKKLQDYTDLEYNEELCTKLINSEQISKHLKEKEYLGGIYYADFETDTTTNPHTPYLAVLIGGNDFVKKGFYESDNSSIGQRLLNYLPHNSLTYFHRFQYLLQCEYFRYMSSVNSIMHYIQALFE